MLAMNIAACLVGLAAYLTIAVPRWRSEALRRYLICGLALVLLATALAGLRVEGAARWATIGPLTLQVSLIVVPVMLVLFARASSKAGAAGLCIAALALAMQPDRGMAGALAASLAVLAAFRPDRVTLIALVAAISGFAVTLARPDKLPAVPFVDQVFYSSFAVHPLAGAAVLIGTCLLIGPALMRLREAGGRDAALAFGAVWLAIAIAAAIGNYPTPVVAYGGSAIVGYFLSLAVLRPVPASLGARQPGSIAIDGRGDERSLSASLA
jgi:hypothetical protein